MEGRYAIPKAVRDYIKGQGYPMPYTAMSSSIESWKGWLNASNVFYDYLSRDSGGALYKVHRRSVRPAKRVCSEWASLLLNEDTAVQCEDEICNNWLSDFYDQINFWSLGQGLVSRSFGVGTGGWAMWLDLANRKMQIRRHAADMLIPLSWDDDGVTECAFVSQAIMKGETITQVQMHVVENGAYCIQTACFTKEGQKIAVDGVEESMPTGCETPTFALVRPNIDNTVVDFSPYGMSVFADAVDALQAVDLAYDAVFNEIDLGKMRVLLADALLEIVDSDGRKVPVPFGRDDNVVWRKVASASEDMVEVVAPKLRTEEQLKGYRMALQTLGDLTGFGPSYFDTDKSGGIKTATEVASDNSQLMRNVRKHENLLGDSVAQISKAVLHCAREVMKVSLPPEGNVTCSFDDSIIQDTAAEKTQDMAEVNVTMNPWEYRMKWYNEDEATAKANTPGNAPIAPEGFQGA